MQSATPLQLRFFGPLTIRRDGLALALPGSRKVRALLAYLALAPQGVTRSQLCDLLWDVPNDPRGELRWCLSKVRGLLDEPGRGRVETAGDTVTLDLADCQVDAIEILRAAESGLQTIAPERLKSLAALSTGEFLEGLDLDRSPAFNSWLAAQRRRFRGWRATLLEHLAVNAAEDEVQAFLDQWLELSPYELPVHERLFSSLARRGLIREGEEHLAATAKLFEAEGLNCAPIRAAWRSAKARADTVPAVVASAPGPATAAPPLASESIRVLSDTPALLPRRASVAVMPFVDRTVTGHVPGGAADGFAHDVITRLAKLRSLFVIAQGTVFALRDRLTTPEQAGRLLNVDYVVSGSFQRGANCLTVSVELADTQTARIVWAEVFHNKPDDTFLVLDEIGNRIVASIAAEIETAESKRAILKQPDSLDAWEAHHRGLWHMYRFNRADNELAQRFFASAVDLDPTFSRAHAGLSFTHWQNVFQGWAGRDRQREIDLAFETAGQGLMADDRDPAARLAMGRALWLRGSQDQSVSELVQAVDLSPNYAMAYYNLAFVQCQAGDPTAAIEAADHSRHLSPFDPLLFGKFASRAVALVRLGRFEEAADWGVKAAARPNAQTHIRAIAAYSLALAGRLDEARSQIAEVRRTFGDYGIDQFLAAFHFGKDGEALFREGAKQIA